MNSETQVGLILCWIVKTQVQRDRVKVDHSDQIQVFCAPFCIYDYSGLCCDLLDEYFSCPFVVFS